MKNRQSSLAIVLLAAGMLQGCSIGMAFSGDEKLDLTALDKGTSRGKVLTVFGTPAQTVATATGRTDVFYKKQGDRRSAGRGAAYIVADALTLGVAEFITAPIEAAATLSDNVVYVVEYDEHDKVVGSSVTNTGKSRRKVTVGGATTTASEASPGAAESAKSSTAPSPGATNSAKPSSAPSRGATNSAKPASAPSTPPADLSTEVSVNERVDRQPVD